MAMHKVTPIIHELETYRGVPVLSLRVGEPIPKPTLETLYAVRVYPDLARYLLSLNHPLNRSLRTRKYKQYATDMASGRWRWNVVQTVAFGLEYLQNGQNTLMAVTEYGADMMLPIWFGCPPDLIDVLDRGAAKTNADAMRHAGASSPNVVAAAIAIWARYLETVGTTRSWSGMSPPSSGESLAIYDQDPDGWQEACRAGERLYGKLDRGLSPSMWAGLYRVIYDDSPEGAEQFFREVNEGSASPRSATRSLRDWCMRRPLTITRTGDKREPAELIVRAYNAWVAGKSYRVVRQQGFVLSRVRS